MKTHIPWLVTERDFRRYLGRALDTCKNGRVVFFYHRYRDERRTVMLALAPYKQWEEHLTSACASFAAGRFRRVVLADLPPIKRHIPV